MNVALFYIFALLTTLSAFGVVISRNIVRTCVLLLGALIGVAGLYFLLGAEFLAAVQLVIYAGGTLVLIIFGVMLTSRSLAAHDEPKKRETWVALAIGAVLATALVIAIVTRFQETSAFPASTTPYPIESLGLSFVGDYLLAFELASVVLLVVMIGAAYLAKTRRRDEEAKQP